MSQNRNLEIDSCDKKNSATALWDKNLKFPSTQVCPLLFPFLCQTFYVIRCHFVSFYATQKNQGIKRVIQNSWLSTGSWYLDLIPIEVLWAKIFMFQYTLFSSVLKLSGKMDLFLFVFSSFEICNIASSSCHLIICWWRKSSPLSLKIRFGK